MSNFDILGLGELLIDFTENGTSNQGNPLLEANPGGGVPNLLSMATKLGEKCGFIGKVGNDIWGKHLKDTLEEVGIDSSFLFFDEEVNTTLAFVKTFPDGDRDFSFYRNPGADMMLKESEVPTDAIKNCKIFHFSSLSMTHDDVHEATLKALDAAHSSGALISFDPNLRPPLWSSLDLAKERISEGISHCDILKISDNEILWISGKDTFDEAVEWIRDKFPNIKLMTLSKGSDGSSIYYNNLAVHENAVLTDKTIETTGAGDTFGACILHFVNRYGIDGFDEGKLRETLVFANNAASILTTRKGALRVMPSKEEVLSNIR